MTADQVAALTDSLQRFGFVDPIIINSNKDRKNIIIGGHQRIRIARELGIKDIPCVEFDLTAEKERELNIRLNKNTGEWDWDALANYFDVGELTEWGFADDELQFYDDDFGDSGNDWNYNYKDLDQVGDGLAEELGFNPHSMWYNILRNYGDIKNYLIKLPKRENSNPHQDKYSRPNPESIRRIIGMYMREGDYFLENCCGWSTFGCIAKYFGYNGVGVDIWDTAIEYSKKQINHMKGEGKVEIKKMDGMAMDFEDAIFDYLYCNPPFMDTELYSKAKNDIGQNFNENINKLMSENYRVLKNGALCTIIIGDKRKNGFLQSLQAMVINAGISARFKLHDFVVVEQLGVANIYRKKAFAKKRSPKNHEYVITFIKQSRKN